MARLIGHLFFSEKMKSSSYIEEKDILYVQVQKLRYGWAYIFRFWDQDKNVMLIVSGTLLMPLIFKHERKANSCRNFETKIVTGWFLRRDALHEVQSKHALYLQGDFLERAPASVFYKAFTVKMITNVLINSNWFIYY